MSCGYVQLKQQQRIVRELSRWHVLRGHGRQQLHPLRHWVDGHSRWQRELRVVPRRDVQRPRERLVHPLPGRVVWCRARAWRLRTVSGGDEQHRCWRNDAERVPTLRERNCRGSWLKLVYPAVPKWDSDIGQSVLGVPCGDVQPDAWADQQHVQRLPSWDVLGRTVGGCVHFVPIRVLQPQPRLDVVLELQQLPTQHVRHGRRGNLHRRMQFVSSRHDVGRWE